MRFQMNEKQGREDTNASKRLHFNFLRMLDFYDIKKPHYEHTEKLIAKHINML
jgi:hypothetical protein